MEHGHGAIFILKIANFAIHMPANHVLNHTVFNYSGGECQGARRSSVVRAFAHGAMGRRIDPSWGGPIELFLVPASAPRLM